MFRPGRKIVGENAHYTSHFSLNKKIKEEKERGWIFTFEIDAYIQKKSPKRKLLLRSEAFVAKPPIYVVFKKLGCTMCYFPENKVPPMKKENEIYSFFFLNLRHVRSRWRSRNFKSICRSVNDARLSCVGGLVVFFIVGIFFFDAKMKWGGNHRFLLLLLSNVCVVKILY